MKLQESEHKYAFSNSEVFGWINYIFYRNPNKSMRAWLHKRDELPIDILIILQVDWPEKFRLCRQVRSFSLSFVTFCISLGPLTQLCSVIPAPTVPLALLPILPARSGQPCLLLFPTTKKVKGGKYSASLCFALVVKCLLKHCVSWD